MTGLARKSRPAIEGLPSLAARARAIASSVAAVHAEAVDREGRFPRETIAALRDAGLLGAMIPKALGGEGASLIEIANICTILGHACASSAMVFAMHQIKMSSLVTHGMESPWHRAFMIECAKKGLLLASATTEGGIGGDLRNSICAVARQGERFTLEKNAMVISYAKEADAILITARRADDAVSSDQVLVVVRKDQYALAQTTVWDTLGMRGTCSEGFTLTAEGPHEQIFPKPFAEIAAQSMLANSHIFWGALWFGIASEAVVRAQAFVRAEARRRPGVVPPGALRLTEIIAMLQTMKSDLMEGIRRFEAAKIDEDDLNSMGFLVAINNLKVNLSSLMVRVVEAAFMICGIHGYRNDSPFSLGRLMRDALSAPIMINNDRILGNTSNMLLVHKYETGLIK